MKKILLIFIGLSIGFYSCKKDDTETNNNTSNIVLDFFKNNLENEKQIYSIDITFGSWIIGNKGTEIYIPPCSFLDNSGNTVTGTIEFELIEAQTNLDMLKLNRPTFTKDGRLLVSGGIVYVNATQNGTPLRVNDTCGLQTQIPTNNFDNLQMQLFTGSEDENGVFSWEEDDDTVTTTWGGQSSGNEWMVYDFEIDSLGWINCDYFYNSGDSLTGIQVELPNEYDGSNSSVLISYNAINSAAGLYDPDHDGVFDLGSGYETPIGMDVKFVAIAEFPNDDYYYHITSTTTVVLNHYETIPSMTGPISHSALEVILNNNLP